MEEVLNRRGGSFIYQSRIRNGGEWRRDRSARRKSGRHVNHTREVRSREAAGAPKWLRSLPKSVATVTFRYLCAGYPLSAGQPIDPTGWCSLGPSCSGWPNSRTTWTLRTSGRSLILGGGRVALKYDTESLGLLCVACAQRTVHRNSDTD